MTDTSEKQQLAEYRLKQNRPKPPKSTKNTACKQIEVRLQSDSDRDEVVADLAKVNCGDDEHDAATLAPNDYIMVFVSKKVIRQYVGVVVKTTDELADIFEVTFIKCNVVRRVLLLMLPLPLAGSRSLTRKTSSMCHLMTLARLLVPTVLGGTTRTKKMVGNAY